MPVNMTSAPFYYRILKEKSLNLQKPTAPLESIFFNFLSSFVYLFFLFLLKSHFFKVVYSGKVSLK